MSRHKGSTSVPILNAPDGEASYTSLKRATQLHDAGWAILTAAGLSFTPRHSIRQLQRQPTDPAESRIATDSVFNWRGRRPSADDGGRLYWRPGEVIS